MRQIYGLAEASLASQEGLLLKDRRLPASGRAVIPIQKFRTKLNSERPSPDLTISDFSVRVM